MADGGRTAFDNMIEPFISGPRPTAGTCDRSGTTGLYPGCRDRNLTELVPSSRTTPSGSSGRLPSDHAVLSQHASHHPSRGEHA